MKDNDFAKELGYLGFTMRLKRISDALMHEGRKLYSELELDIEPNWYVIFKLLQHEGPKSITEIADRIRMAHPSVITITNKMARADYLTSSKDPEDSRKRVLDLTDKARKNLPRFEQIWSAGEKGIEDALGTFQPLKFMSEMERVFASSGFKDRTINELKSRIDDDNGAH